MQTGICTCIWFDWVGWNGRGDTNPSYRQGQLLQVATVFICFDRVVAVLTSNCNSFNFMLHEELTVGTSNDFLQDLNKQYWYEPSDGDTARLDLSQLKDKPWQKELASDDSL